MFLEVKTWASASPPPGVARGLVRLPELLAPAGDWECARAAVENGADGIYFGLEKFNARMRAHNFTVADLPELMVFLHRRGVKGYVTFNTLIFAEEMAEAVEFARVLITAGVDAAIVQDVGMARLIRSLSPDFPIHASTQMTITSAEGVRFAGRLGCQRVILARECSLKEIASIRAALAEPAEEDGSQEALPELEVFVHGALCVAYSGQCLTSESLGGRSANRGECAQACRLPFELISDGQVVPLGDRRYLLSPQDLTSLELLPEIVAAGVASIKIEGRLKSPEYVAAITGIYRRGLDQMAGPPPAGSAARAAAAEHYEMEMAFSRGLYTGWFHGVNNQELVHGRFGKKRGVYLGQVTRAQSDRVWVRLEAPVKPGDGVVFDAGRPHEKEQGGRVYEVGAARGNRPGTADTMLAFGKNDIDCRRVQVGDRLWKTSDPEMERRVRQSYAGDALRFQRAIRITAHGATGQPLTLEACDGEGHVARVASSMPLAAADRQPLSPERLTEQLGRLGGTPFKLGALDCHIEGPVILPVSELNRLRREVVAKLNELRAQPKRWTLRPVNRDVRVPPLGGVAAVVASEPREQGTPVGTPHASAGAAAALGADFASHLSGSISGRPAEAELVVLVRSLTQMEAAIEAGCSTLYCEFEDPKKYREAVARFKEATSRLVENTRPAAPPTIWVAPPRISKMGEEWVLKQVRSCEADGFLIRNPDHLRAFPDTRRIGDFSLNVANPLAAEHFIRQCGLERVTASYDLNADQLVNLLNQAPAEWFEITLHQHMPMFHMEHCVFCAFLSKGTDYTNCGRPCEKHQVALQDRVGARHPLRADAGCRNTVFNALAQTGAESVHRFLALGAHRFRIEFLDESPDRVTQTIGMYRRLLRGEVSGAHLWRELKLISRLGVTRGQMEKADTSAPRFGEIEW